MYHAACKVEFQPFNRSYSQLTLFIFLYLVYFLMKSTSYVLLLYVRLEGRLESRLGSVLDPKTL